MYAGKPILGIVGGIGSGKSFVAELFADFGCLVIKSDAQVRQVYQQPAVKAALRDWWGQEVFDSAGNADRAKIAGLVFNDSAARKRLEQLIHPRVGELRDQLMQNAASDPAVRAYVWDTPLLYEVGLDSQCDAVVFVHAPLQERLLRVARERGWDAAELDRRENSQMPLDKKRLLAHYVVDNTADAAFARRQVEAVLSRVL